MYIGHTMRCIPKRKFAEVDEEPYSYSYSCPQSSLSPPASSEWESDGESSSSKCQDFPPLSPPSPNSLPIRSILKRLKLAGRQRKVCFDQVTVFSFPRCQGFTNVPSRGGATLGMVRRHSALQRYTVAEHVLEQQHKRRERRRERLRQRLREERLEALKHRLIISGVIDQRKADRLTVDQLPEEDSDRHISDAELEDGGFLQPFSSKQRQALLQAAGVKLIDREEKRQLNGLRLSRKTCGCDCQGFCEPDTCACSLEGIKCQMDHFNFPCGCTKDSCGNTQGRIEFDYKRVQTHHIHTFMRLELERQLQDEMQSVGEQTGLPEELQEYEDPVELHLEPSAQDKTCPLGFTMPAVPSCQFITNQLVVEENSCSSDTTESSCSSSDSDAGGGGGLGGSQNLPEADGGLTPALSLCGSENSTCDQPRQRGEPQTQHGSTPADRMGPEAAYTFTDNMSRTSVTDYLNEDANQATDLFNEDSLEGFPNTPSPTVDYSGSYMELSLSSDSDLEFFDNDYPSGPLHSSFKGNRFPDTFQHLQLCNSVSLPEFEFDTHLLDSLIGLTEPSTEQIYSVTDAQLS
ncbi:cysteine/serine-rich nuclear protein 1-like [Brachyistius frenatus]|uniref:cysteine/serine-rich nuclear protein 1-like n=1 Tax=Brachyistius frenatus TaxID=100188 RepID=UPI0037E932F3